MRSEHQDQDRHLRGAFQHAVFHFVSDRNARVYRRHHCGSVHRRNSWRQCRGMWRSPNCRCDLGVRCGPGMRLLRNGKILGLFRNRLRSILPAGRRHCRCFVGVAQLLKYEACRAWIRSMRRGVPVSPITACSDLVGIRPMRLPATELKYRLISPSAR